MCYKKNNQISSNNKCKNVMFTQLRNEKLFALGLTYYQPYNNVLFEKKNNKIFKNPFFSITFKAIHAIFLRTSKDRYL